MKRIIWSYIKATLFAFLVAGLLGYSLFSRATSSISKTPEGELQGRIELCKAVGRIFGDTAEAVLNKKPLKDTLGEASLFVAMNPGVNPYAASWYGYGYCMAIATGKGDKA